MKPSSEVDLLSRINRWADNLPPTEVIPIGSCEKYELARHFIELTWSNPQPIEKVLHSIEIGRFRYKGHRVILL